MRWIQGVCPDLGAKIMKGRRGKEDTSFYQQRPSRADRSLLAFMGVSTPMAPDTPQQRHISQWTDVQTAVVLDLACCIIHKLICLAIGVLKHYHHPQLTAGISSNSLGKLCFKSTKQINILDAGERWTFGNSTYVKWFLPTGG